MRRLRALLFGLTVLTSSALVPAHAQMAVIDGTNLAQTTLAAQRALSQIQQLTAQYNQLVATYQMLTNPTDVLSMATGLSGPTLQNPLPSANLLNGLVSGQTAASGVGAQFYNQSHIYTPTDGSAASTQMIASANSIANLQGVPPRTCNPYSNVWRCCPRSLRLSAVPRRSRKSTRSMAVSPLKRIMFRRNKLRPRTCLFSLPNRKHPRASKPRKNTRARPIRSLLSTRPARNENVAHRCTSCCNRGGVSGDLSLARTDCGAGREFFRTIGRSGRHSIASIPL